MADPVISLLNKKERKKCAVWLENAIFHWRSSFICPRFWFFFLILHKNWPFLLHLKRYRFVCIWCVENTRRNSCNVKLCSKCVLMISIGSVILYEDVYKMRIKDVRALHIYLWNGAISYTNKTRSASSSTLECVVCVTKLTTYDR